MLQLKIKRILRAYRKHIYPESESDPGLDSRYNLKRGESQGHTHSIYPESESDPGLDSFYNFKLGEPYILE